MVKNVIVLFGAHLPQEFMGIIRYAKHAGWILDTSMIHYSTLPELSKSDGIISAFLSSDELASRVASSGKPWVELGWGYDGIDVPQVWLDNVTIGEMAADYLMGLGLKSLVFYSKCDTLWTRLRREGFSASLKTAGLEFMDLTPGNFHEELPGLSTPVGVFAVEDAKAVTVMRYCAELGLDVPTDVAVLGVDNHPEFGELAPMPITSIEAGRELRGTHAAQLLESMMSGGAVPTTPVLIPPREIIVRQSTDILAVPHEKTRKAIGYIHKNYHDSAMTIASIATHVGLTRRQLDSLFVSHINRTVAAELERQRLCEAKHLLLTSDFSAADIAETCGFSNYSHLSRTLKVQIGHTAREFRQAASLINS